MRSEEGSIWSRGYIHTSHDEKDDEYDTVIIGPTHAETFKATPEQLDYMESMHLRGVNRVPFDILQRISPMPGIEEPVERIAHDPPRPVRNDTPMRNRGGNPHHDNGKGKEKEGDYRPSRRRIPFSQIDWDREIVLESSGSETEHQSESESESESESSESGWGSLGEDQGWIRVKRRGV